MCSSFLVWRIAAQGKPAKHDVERRPMLELTGDHLQPFNSRKAGRTPWRPGGPFQEFCTLRSPQTPWDDLGMVVRNANTLMLSVCGQKIPQANRSSQGPGRSSEPPVIPSELLNLSRPAILDIQPVPQTLIRGAICLSAVNCNFPIRVTSENLAARAIRKGKAPGQRSDGHRRRMLPQTGSASIAPPCGA